MDIHNLLKELTETPGPSGFESRVAEVVVETWRPLADEVAIDRMGSVTASKAGSAAEPRPRLLIAAHLDEIGLMVKQIIESSTPSSENGFLQVTKVGGIDIRMLHGQLVTVHGSGVGHRDLVGVIGALPIHMLPTAKREKALGFDDLVVDTGLPATELKRLVSVGDFVTFRQPLRKLLNERVTGKALDNRASVAAISVCLEHLKGRNHKWDVLAVATAQEETSFLGAYTSAYVQRPDVAIAVDVTFGKGPGATGNETFELGGGPTLGLGPNVHPVIYESLKDAAKALEMDVHIMPHERGSGTDAFALQTSREGIPTGLVAIPLRYMHTTVESLALADVERAGRLLAEFAGRLDDHFLENMTDRMLEE
jgi:putative aminopeptidase FrvX